jgi:UDP-2,3-diacylglucosamine hydrolase
MHVFISDAHIRSDQSERAKMLIRFLSQLKPEITDIYILGDLFEFWFEYNIAFPKDYFRILATLYNLIQDGRRVHYVLGNHEVMIGNFLQNFGFVVHRSETVIDIEGKKVFMAHGNRVDRRLWTWMWEKLLTSKVNHLLYSLLHPDIGVFIAQGIAHLSRKQRRSVQLARMMELYARRKLRDVDIVIMAHSHVPVLKEYADGKYYVNTGDWVTNYTYTVMDRGRISLYYYRKQI